MPRKRLTELSANSDSSGFFLAIDKDGEVSATKLPVVVHTVSTIPVSPEENHLYILTATDGNYPKGLYSCKSDLELSCVNQYEDISIAAWGSSIVSDELVSGVVYSVNVTDTITDLTLTMNTSGSSTLIISNVGLNSIADPNGHLKRTDTGFNDLSSNTTVELVVSKVGSNYISSAVKLI